MLGSSVARSVRMPCGMLALAIVGLAVFAIQPPARCQAQSPVHVRTTSVPRGVWLHRRLDPTAPWLTLCAAACEAEVTRGAELGLSLDGRTVSAAPAITLDGDAVLQLHLDDRHLTRTYGLILSVLGIVGALTLGIGGVSAWVSAGGQGDMTGPVTAMASGAGVLALGLGVGIVLMNEGDHVEITVVP